MSHEPLCPCNESGHTHYEYAPSRVCTYCRCDLIAKVREDERTRHQGQSVMLVSAAESAVAAAKADMLAKALTAVQATITSAPTLGQKKAIAALQALQDTP